MVAARHSHAMFRPVSCGSFTLLTMLLAWNETEVGGAAPTATGHRQSALPATLASHAVNAGSCASAVPTRRSASAGRCRNQVRCRLA